MPPEIIHQFWTPALTLPPLLGSMIGTWKQHHPSWEHRFWTDNNLPTLANQDLYDRAEEISPGAPEQFRSDVARYEILYHHGGVWVDVDFWCQRPIDELMRPLFAGREGRWLNNALIGAEREHPLMAELVQRLPGSVKRRKPTEGNTVKSGPQFFTPIARSHGIHEYPQHYFFPYLWNELHRGREDFPDSYAVHHWNNQRRLRGVPLASV